MSRSKAFKVFILMMASSFSAAIIFKILTNN